MAYEKAADWVALFLCNLGVSIMYKTIAKTG